MATAARRRLVSDLRRLQKDAPHGIAAAPSQEDVLKWTAVIFGGSGTPFEDGVFRLSLTFSESYPNEPPKVKFLSKMFHPNIYNDGSICLDILSNNWTPVYDVVSILTSIQSLLGDPNPASPANSQAARLYTTDKAEYLRRVRETVEESLTAQI
ncbi:hypothetical protein RCL1_003999 [Eukaryota sp. TZLM3-RCL]